MAKATLRQLLNKHKGVDTVKLKQKKHMKEVERKKTLKNEFNDEEAEDDDDDDDEDEDEEGGIMVFDAEGQAEEGFSADEESEEDEEGYDLARLDESDSDSEDDEATKRALEGVAKALAAKGASTKAKVVVANNNDEEEDDDDDDDDDGDDEDDEEENGIALSDLDDTGSIDEDIVPYQRLTINNTSALQRSLASFALPYSSMTFSEHQTIISTTPTDIPDVDDDLNRELAFYAQSLAAAKEARARLRKEGVPFTRPADYFAEMVKSDEHMGKVKGKLVEDAASKKASQDARRQRDLKKFGKQVQQEKLKERAKEKKDMLDNVKALKRKRKDSGLDTTHEEDIFDVALEDAATTQKKDRDERRAKAAGQHKRKAKDAKFGFGGKKRHAKEGDAKSAGDMRDYSVKKMKAGGAKQRPGKSKRAKLSR